MADKEKSKSNRQKRKLNSLLPDKIAILPFIEMKSNREVTLEGCKGILEYNSEVIRINAGAMVVSFKGRGLNIKCMSLGGVVISGFITAVEFVC